MSTADFFFPLHINSFCFITCCITKSAQISRPTFIASRDGFLIVFFDIIFLYLFQICPFKHISYIRCISSFFAQKEFSICLDINSPVPVSYIYCLFLVVKTVPRLYPRSTSMVPLIFFRCSFIFLLLSKTFSIICLSTSYLFLLFFVIHSLNCFFMISLFLLYVFCVDSISYIYSKKEHPPVITTNGCFSSLYILFSLLYLDQYFLIHTHSDVTLQSFLQYRDLNHFLQPFYF